MSAMTRAGGMASSATAGLDGWTQRLLAGEELCAMGHAQKGPTNDLGLGWVYYGLARVIDPDTAVVIGSHRGFVPMTVGRALADNGRGGRVLFIDPSLVDDFWRDPRRVRDHFAGFGLDNIEHHCRTTQAFTESAAYRAIVRVDLVFIDGYHSYEQARFDFAAFEPLVSPRGVILFHDSIRIRPTSVYGPDKVYEHRVRVLMDELRRDARYQVFDLPFGDGLTLVRKPAAPEVLFA
jgi:predicted O-methyltransferase YrrM